MSATNAASRFCDEISRSRAAVLVSSEGAGSEVHRVALTRAGQQAQPPAPEQDEPLPWGPIAAGAVVLAVLLVLARRAHG